MSPAHAEQQDIAAAVRGVVRVVIIATKGDEAYFVGHGSGFVVAPDKILTNAHVVELLRAEKNLVIGIVPSEGKRSYGGKLIAYSPGNDLALVELEALLLAALFVDQDREHVRRFSSRLSRSYLPAYRRAKSATIGEQRYDTGA